MELVDMVVYIGFFVGVIGQADAPVSKEDDPHSVNCIQYENGRCMCCESGWIKEDSNCVNKCEKCKNRFQNGVCHKQCISGFWGANCTSKCPIHCAKSNGNVSYCDKDTGDCPAKGCEPGFWGIKCESKCNKNCVDRRCWRNGTCLKCPDRLYGDTCEHTCSEGCDDQLCNRDGSCSCIRGWLNIGKGCAYNIQPSINNTIGESILKTLLVITVAVVLICLKKYANTIKRGYNWIKSTCRSYKLPNDCACTQNKASNTDPETQPMVNPNQVPNDDIEVDSMPPTETDLKFPVEEVDPRTEKGVFNTGPKKKGRDGTIAETP